MFFGVVGQVVQWMTFLTVGLGSPSGKGQFLGEGIGQRNVGLTCRKNVALQCGCSIPTAE